MNSSSIVIKTSIGNFSECIYEIFSMSKTSIKGKHTNACNQTYIVYIWYKY